MICKRCGELVDAGDVAHDCPHGKPCTGAVLFAGASPAPKVAACGACRMRPIKARRNKMRPGQQAGLERHIRASVDARARGEGWSWSWKKRTA